MAKRDFDFKQFMLQKGDKVGIAVAGGVAVLLLLLGVFMLFGKGGSLNPSANAEGLNKTSAEREQQLASSQPSAAERDKLRVVDPELKKKHDETLLASQFPLDKPLMSTVGAEDAARRSPNIFPPTEFLARIVNAQLSFYMFDKDREMVAVLVGADSKKSGGGGPNLSKFGGGMRGGSMPPGGGGMPGGKGGLGGFGGMPGGGAYGPGQMGPGGTKLEDKIVRFVKIDDLKQSEMLAENLVPFRAAMIVGAFPLKKELEEYKKALHVATLGELYDPAHPESGFGFLGLKVQRREVSGDGEGPQGPWIDVPLEDAFKWWALSNGRRFEPEEPDLLPLIQWSEGLVMERPEQIKDRSQPYPSLETELPGIKKSLEQLKGENKKGPPPKNPFKDSDGLDPFRHGGSPVTGGAGLGEGAMTKGGNAVPPPNTLKPGPGGAGAGSDIGVGAKGQNLAGQKVEAPEFALIRFLDVYVDPGKTYEYQVKVLLNNPNYNRTDVPSYLAEKKELESEWTPVGRRLFVPEEIQYYAFDAPRAGVIQPQSNQAVVQIHRWVPSVNVNPKSSRNNTDLPVGEWLVAERVLVYRGENIGQTHKLKVPVWMFSQAAFGLATNPAVPRDKHSIDVPFSGSNNDGVLVDFTPPYVSYKKLPKAKDDVSDPVSVEVKEKAPIELLILTADGKFVVRDSDTDKADKEREKRVEQWKERIKKVEEGDKPAKPGEGLFNNKGTGGGAGGQ